MDDFFLRLAARSLGRLPVVRPLFRSRFDPAAAESADPFPPGSWGESDFLPPDREFAAALDLDSQPLALRESVTPRDELAVESVWQARPAHAGLPDDTASKSLSSPAPPIAAGNRPDALSADAEPDEAGIERSGALAQTSRVEAFPEPSPGPVQMTPEHSRRGGPPPGARSARAKSEGIGAGETLAEPEDDRAGGATHAKSDETGYEVSGASAAVSPGGTVAERSIEPPELTSEHHRAGERNKSEGTALAGPGPGNPSAGPAQLTSEDPRAGGRFLGAQSGRAEWEETAPADARPGEMFAESEGPRAGGRFLEAQSSRAESKGTANAEAHPGERSAESEQPHAPGRFLEAQSGRAKSEGTAPAEPRPSEMFAGPAQLTTEGPLEGERFLEAQSSRAESKGDPSAGSAQLTSEAPRAGGRFLEAQSTRAKSEATASAEPRPGDPSAEPAQLTSEAPRADGRF